MYQLMTKENVEIALSAYPDLQATQRMAQHSIYQRENEYCNFLFDLLQELYIDEGVRIAIEPGNATRYLWCISTITLECHGFGAVVYHDCAHDELLILPMEIMSPNEILNKVSSSDSVWTRHPSRRYLVAEMHNAICNMQHLSLLEDVVEQYEPMFYSFKLGEIIDG